MKLTNNLSRAEFKCQCGCGFDTVDYNLIIDLQSTVDHFQSMYPNRNIRIKINSGSRCKAHNKAVGGSRKSQHIYGKAADFFLYDRDTKEIIDPEEVVDYLINRFPNSRGIGRYENRTHFDSRETMARW